MFIEDEVFIFPFYIEMILNILGQKIRPEIVLLIMIVGAFIGLNMWCSCAGGIREGFDAGVKISGAALDYTIGDGISHGWKDSAIQQDKFTPSDWYNQLKNNVGGTIPLPESELFMFSDTEFAPRCCPSTYTNSTGCACLNTDQAQYLNQRGGNRTQETIY
jgi:hypothetical protein